MKEAIVTLKSLSPYGQSRHYVAPKLEKESAEDYEARTWRNRMHVTSDGYVFIPPMAFKLALEQAAAFIGMQIPGRGKATYTKHFTAGVMCTEPLVLPLKVDEVKGEWLFVPPDGKKGGPRRVNKCFPRIDSWSGAIRFLILDDTITQKAFQYHMEQAGQFIGIGFFRPRNGGFWGRFAVEEILWDESNRNFSEAS